MGIGREVLSIGIIGCSDTTFENIGGGTTISPVLVGSDVNKIG